MTDFKPLSLINPSWQLKLIPSAVDAAIRGVEREKIRLAGSTYLALLFRREYDYDGLTKYLQILEGFTDESAAVDYVNQVAERTLVVLLSVRENGNRRWFHDVSCNGIRFVENHDSPLVQGVHMKSFRVRYSLGYDSKYFQFEVLRVRNPVVIGPDLFGYFDEEGAWAHYLIERGRGCPEARTFLPAILTGDTEGDTCQDTPPEINLTTTARIGLDFMRIGIERAVFHIENGARSFADYSMRMVEDLGEDVRPYLCSFYAAIRNYPRFDNAGMGDPEGRDKHGPEKGGVDAPLPLRDGEMTESLPSCEKLGWMSKLPRLSPEQRAAREGRTRRLGEELCASIRSHKPEK